MPARKESVQSSIYQIKVTLVGTKPPIWRRRFGMPDPHSPFPQTEIESERKTPLSSVFERGGAKLTYLYDFGDDWEHVISLEKQLPPDPNAELPSCVGGAQDDGS